MDGLALLQEARAAGVTVEIDGEGLRVKSPRSAAELAERVIANRAAVIDALGDERSTKPVEPGVAMFVGSLPGHERERFHERAAVAEYDGELSRLDAERFALAEIKPELRGMMETAAMISRLLNATIVEYTEVAPDECSAVEA